MQNYSLICLCVSVFVVLEGADDGDDDYIDDDDDDEDDAPDDSNDAESSCG